MAIIYAIINLICIVEHYSINLIYMQHSLFNSIACVCFTAQKINQNGKEEKKKERKTIAETKVKHQVIEQLVDNFHLIASLNIRL